VCRTAALAKLDASGGGGTSVRTDFRVGGDEPHRLIAAFIERAKENRFRGSFSRKALQFRVEKTHSRDWRLAVIKRADCRSDRPFAAAPGTHAGRL
jgi:hypothetical protein